MFCADSRCSVKHVQTACVTPEIRAAESNHVQTVCIRARVYSCRKVSVHLGFSPCCCLHLNHCTQKKTHGGSGCFSRVAIKTSDFSDALNTNQVPLAGEALSSFVAQAIMPRHSVIRRSRGRLRSMMLLLVAQRKSCALMIHPVLGLPLPLRGIGIKKKTSLRRNHRHR